MRKNLIVFLSISIFTTILFLSTLSIVKAGIYFKFDFTGPDYTPVSQYNNLLHEYGTLDGEAYLLDNKLVPFNHYSQIAVDSYFNTVDQCASVDVLFPNDRFVINVRGDSATMDVGYILDITKTSGTEYSFTLYDNTEYSHYTNNQYKTSMMSDGYHNIQICAIGNAPAIITSYIDYVQDQTLTTIPYSGEFWNEGLVGEPSFLFTNLVDNFTFSDSFIQPNTAPQIGQITSSSNPVQVGLATNLSASFTDTGIFDTHTAVWDWGDGTTTSGTVTESNGSGAVVGTHTYNSAGVYTVLLTVSDNYGGVGTSSYQYQTVFDPSAGWVTGGKDFNTQIGAANFGFTARYDTNGDINPIGNQWASLLIKSGNSTIVNFNATSYESLVVNGSKVTLRGSGAYNNQPGYKLLITAIDGSVINGNGLIRYQIKDSLNNVVFDTQVGSPDTADPTTVVTKGKIAVH